MLFNSYLFLLIFLPATLSAFSVAARFGANQLSLQIILILASCIFIGSSGWLSLVLLLFSLGVNYFLLRRLSVASDTRIKFGILVTSVAANLSLIAIFKYANFIVQSLGRMAGYELPQFDIPLPLAISFYTFQLIALTVDNWRLNRKCPPLGRLVLFVTFFPQLIAGPIVRYDEVKHDIGNLCRLEHSNLAIGAALVSIGLFKKAALADNLAPIADTFFSGVAAGAIPSFTESWGGTLAYTFQIYFDFSGYSDIAIGLACMFGIHLPANFYSPYRACSIIEFWRRWHMTLSRFLRDYLYIPMGGNKEGLWSRWRNVFITMLLGGLWHGASWNFVIWGGMHGVFIAFNHLVRRIGISVYWPVAWFTTFFLVVCSWVVFRTQDIVSATRIYAGMFGFNGIVLPERLEPTLGGLVGDFSFVSFASSELFRLPNIFPILIAGAIALAFSNSEQIVREAPDHERFAPRRAALAGVAFVVGIFGIQQAVEFVYFRF